MDKTLEMEFDFGPLNPKRHHRATKWAKAPGVKFEFGPIKMVVVGFGGPQIWAKTRE
jgi:hypothetical protein